MFWVCEFVLIVVVRSLVKCLNNSIEILAVEITTTIFESGVNFIDCLPVFNQR
jgi:hypothetical protein